MKLKDLIGKRVEVLTEVSDGAGDVKKEWTPGTVTGEYTVPDMQRHTTGQRPGIVVHVPGAAYKNKHINIEDGLIDSTVR